MSLRRRSPPPAAVSISPEYVDRFIGDAHVIVAEGYARLDPATLQAKQEPDISGLIVGHSRAWLEDPRSPDWAGSYFVTEEKFEDESSLEGMNRPRIDIHIESSFRRPRPRFVFEAKRLYRSDSVAAYVGPDGLGALCDGTYAATACAAGMLGYVQSEDVGARAAKVGEKLDRERAAHGITPEGPVWVEVVLDHRLGVTRRSAHAPTGRAPIDVYHSFLKCWGSAPTPDGFAPTGQRR